MSYTRYIQLPKINKRQAPNKHKADLTLYFFVVSMLSVFSLGLSASSGLAVYSSECSTAKNRFFAVLSSLTCRIISVYDMSFEKVFGSIFPSSWLFFFSLLLFSESIIFLTLLKLDNKSFLV